MTDPSNLRHALFSPRAVALVGASGDAAKVNSRPQRVLRQHAYAGRVLPINPARGELGGVRAYPTLHDAPGPIDHAFVMVPGRAVAAHIKREFVRMARVVKESGAKFE